MAYAWPGNVRELSTVIDRAAILGDGKLLDVAKSLGVPSLPAPAKPASAEPPQALKPKTTAEIIPLDEVIRRHVEAVYTVCAIGFCPGFPYLGYLPAPLCGVPRLEAPRLRVEAGSVGMTGRQTGIYTEMRPGGWNLIGRTPLELVNVADGYFPLRTGERGAWMSVRMGFSL